MKNDKKTGSLAVNTIMLYVLTLSNYIFSFLTVPYQTRILGPELYGILGFAFSVMVYFQLLMDFGFTLSGTAEITMNRNDKKKIAVIMESIIVGKIMLFILSAIIIFILTLFVEQFGDNRIVFLICFMYTFMNTLIPDFLYRGLEVMKPITYRTVLVKFIFTIGIFIFVKKPSDYLWIPMLYLLGSIIAVIIAYIDSYRRFQLPFVKINKEDVIIRLKEAFPFFVSRIASTVYGATNSLILGMKYSGESILGYYTSADKIVSLARTGASPIADSLYPYMISHKNYKLVRKLLYIFMPIIISGSIILFIFAPQICVLVFGAGYESVAVPLRCLTPVIIIVLPTYILGFPMMTPLGIANHANRSVIYGAIIQIILLAILWATNNLGLISICVATSITEISVFMYRVVLVLYYIKKKKDIIL